MEIGLLAAFDGADCLPAVSTVTNEIDTWPSWDALKLTGPPRELPGKLDGLSPAHGAAAPPVGVNVQLIW